MNKNDLSSDQSVEHTVIHSFRNTEGGDQEQTGLGDNLAVHKGRDAVVYSLRISIKIDNHFVEAGRQSLAGCTVESLLFTIHWCMLAGLNRLTATTP